MNTLAFLVMLFAYQASPVSSGVVTVLHGARTEWVFTQPVIVTARDDEGGNRSARREANVRRIRAKLAMGDDGGTIHLGSSSNGGPDVYDIASTSERGDCAWYGPRLDGTTVKVCGGSVVAVALGSDVREVR